MAPLGEIRGSRARPGEGLEGPEDLRRAREDPPLAILGSLSLIRLLRAL